MYVRAPEPILPFEGPSLFLAGGITDCEDWQEDISRTFSLYSQKALRVFNPRRLLYKGDKLTAIQQITWEVAALDKSSFVLFWFSKNSVCPITLFELGKALGREEQTVIVGAHPEYSRRLDLLVQIGLSNPTVPTFDNLYEATMAMLELAHD